MNEHYREAPESDAQRADRMQSERDAMRADRDEAVRTLKRMQTVGAVVIATIIVGFFAWMSFVAGGEAVAWPATTWPRF